MILNVKVTTARSKVKSRSHHDATHIQLQSINILQITVSEIQPGQVFSPSHLDAMGENNTHPALQGGGVKNIHTQQRLVNHLLLAESQMYERPADHQSYK